MVDVTELYPENPGTAEATAGSATAAQADRIDPNAGSFTPTEAEASHAGTRDAAALAGSTTGYKAFEGTVTDDMTAAGQMNNITSTDSPNMRRAAQQGMLTAGRRGLENSSFAAGAAQGAMVDRATPLALQDAQTYFSQARANQDAVNRQREVTSGRRTDTSRFNADLATRVDLANAAAYNEAERLNASLETAVSQGNAQEANRIKTRIAELNAEIDMRNAALETETNRFNAQLETDVSRDNARMTNEMRSQIISSVAALNERYMIGEQAIDLADIQGRYQTLISTNETAGRLFDSYFSSIGAAMANHEMEPSRIAAIVNVQGSMLEAGLRMMDAMNGIDLGTFELPGASGNLTPTPGSGEAVTGQPAPTSPTPTYPYPTYPYSGFNFGF